MMENDPELERLKARGKKEEKLERSKGVVR